MRRGDVVVVSAPGDHGKPRPAVVIQTDAIPEDSLSVVIVQFTTSVERSILRVDVAPDGTNGLREPSQAMADKPTTVRRARVGGVIGRLSDRDLARVTSAVAFVIGAADG